MDEEAAPQPGKMTYPPPPPPEGEEEMEEKPGDTYTGGMQHGVRHGRGRYTFGGGPAAYEGEYVEGRREGRGVMRFPDGGSYDGEWVADKMEGTGTYTYASGDVFRGGFKAGRKSGAGADGCQFHGAWSEGDFVEGRWVWRDGSMFAGAFDASKPAQGKHWFSGSHLVQAGRYIANGAWVGSDVAAGSAAAVL
ncbi:hypothetical protein Rsub_04258 [Raphidocelis subcapitata]|uniref:Uncharacterized protein n=1 Tax=Raphidocelis subcapitata TaxID=307507 RepID=A0A2V0NV51_9CHLO|nr:hypothetical protein Rsub_04258 [Raphidocelis subcapitata]|eukprot:GBF91518.1 hypothetical protein Rsub_04258 [Raphidocelis subcapitata]